MKKQKAVLWLTVFFLGAMLLFSACSSQDRSVTSITSSKGGNSSSPHEEESPSPPRQTASPSVMAGSVSGVEPAPTPGNTPSPTSGESPAHRPLWKTVEREITTATERKLSLLLEDGSQWTVDLEGAAQQEVDYSKGNEATVTYDENQRNGTRVKAASVQTSVPERYGKVDQLLSGMTLEEKVGQMFFVRCPDSQGAQDVERYQFGGYILFGRDFKGLTADQVRANVESYQEKAKIPLLIGVDEEGGTVVRVSANPNLCEEPYWSPRSLYNTGGLSLVAWVERDKLQVLSDLRINVNFAPVCDISQDPEAFMYDRSLGRDPETTSQYIQEMVGIYRENSVGCVLKHFPGYGDNADTHTGVAIDQRPYERFRQEDFLPFQAGAQAGAGCVLVSHNVVTCVDSEYPASLSVKWHEELRKNLGFDGCVITDDLIMGAIQEYCDASSAAVQAVIAGNDLLCCSDYETQYPAVLEAVKMGEISQERIDQSVRRILRWKVDLNLLGQPE